MPRGDSAGSRAATWIVSAAFAFFGVTGGLIYISESIPDNARIYVYPGHQTWVPDAFFMSRDFERQLADPATTESARQWLSQQRPALYKDVKRGGRYEDFNTFPVLLEEPGNILRGWDGSLLMSWVLRRPRWNADGSWNW